MTAALLIFGVGFFFSKSLIGAVRSESQGLKDDE